jgi:hypothetical protein
MIFLRDPPEDEDCDVAGLLDRFCSHARCSLGISSPRPSPWFGTSLGLAELIPAKPLHGYSGLVPSLAPSADDFGGSTAESLFSSLSFSCHPSSSPRQGMENTHPIHPGLLAAILDPPPFSIVASKKPLCGRRTRPTPRVHLTSKINTLCHPPQGGSRCRREAYEPSPVIARVGIPSAIYIWCEGKRRAKAVKLHNRAVRLLDRKLPSKASVVESVLPHQKIARTSSYFVRRASNSEGLL